MKNKAKALVYRHRAAERTSAEIFGLTMMVVFVGMLLLNAISR